MHLRGYGFENMSKAKVLRTFNTVELPLNGGEIQLNFADGTVSLFTAREIVFHAPSEHTFMG